MLATDLPRPTPETLAERLASLLGDLARAIAGHRPPDPAGLPLLTAAWAWVRRRADRLAGLLARFQAGTLRPPRRHPPKPQAAEAAATPEPPPPRPRPQRLPRSAAWLLRRVPDTPIHASQLQQWLADPALPAFLAAAPQVGRLLRPLCRALGVPIPEFLRLPPTPGQVARAEAQAAWTAACQAARAEEAWGRRLRRSLGLRARRPDDVRPISPLEFLPPARPPPKRD